MLIHGAVAVEISVVGVCSRVFDGFGLVGFTVFHAFGLTFTGWGPLVISRVIRALNWVIRTLS